MVITFPRSKPKLLSGAQYVDRYYKVAYPAEEYNDDVAKREESSDEEAHETENAVEDDAKDNVDAEIRIVRMIRRFRKTRLTDLGMLAEAWPTEYTSAYKASIAGKKVSAMFNPPQNSSRSIPSLADLTVKSAAEHALNSGDVDGIEQLIWLPGKAGLIKDTLRSQDPFPDSAIGLLSKVISHELKSNTVIDHELSSFSLTSDQFVELFYTQATEFPLAEAVNCREPLSLSLDVRSCSDPHYSNFCAYSEKSQFN